MNSPQDFHSNARTEMIGGGIGNAVINGLLAWLMLRGGSNLTLVGQNSYAVDIAATAFILPFIVTLIVVSLNRRKFRAGKVSIMQLDPENLLHAAALRFPRNLLAQAGLFGLVATLVTTPLLLGGLWITGIDEFTPAAYAVFKGTWAGLLATILTIPMLLVALKQPA